MAFYLALAFALGAALSRVLHVLGQKSPKAEKAAEVIDAVESEAQSLLPAAAQPPAAPAVPKQ